MKSAKKEGFSLSPVWCRRERRREKDRSERKGQEAEGDGLYLNHWDRETARGRKGRKDGFLSLISSPACEETGERIDRWTRETGYLSLLPVRCKLSKERREE